MSQENAGCGTVPFCGTPTCDGLTCEAEQVQRAHIRLQADQPVVPVPVYQEIQKRDKYIEVPQVEVKDSIVPKVYNQSAVHDVPKVHVDCGERNLAIETEKVIERDVQVPVHVGYAPQFVPKWDIREVPRPVPKYEGEQQIIEIEVPQIEYKDTYVEKEVVVDVKEKIVPKVTEVVKEVEVMQYEWKEKYQDVPVYKYVPKFDVELDCPPPLIVPYTETRYVQDEPQTSNPYCGWSACCTQVHQEPHIKTVEKAVRTEQQRLYPGSAQLTEANMNYPMGQDFASQFQKSTEERVLRGNSVSDGPVRQAVLSQLPPGPVYPKPTPQVGAADKSKSGGARLNEKKQSFWSWLTGKKEEEQTPTVAEKFGYPENMPTDFAAAFQGQGAPVNGGPSPQPADVDGASPEEKDKPSDELEPSVVYRGAVNKPPEYGGELDPISFKLHAIEIHQFVPLPNMEAPEFVKALSSGIMTNDVSGLEKFFGGHVPAGWADPDVTGIPATTMSDILSGNAQNVGIMSPLVCQLSSQFAKQGFVPGGTQDMTHVGSFKRNTSEPQQ